MLRAEGFDIKTNILLYKYCIEPYVTRTINYVYTSCEEIALFSLSLVGSESYRSIMFAGFILFIFIYLWFAIGLPAVLHFVDSVMVLMNVLEINAIYFHVVVVPSSSVVVMVLDITFSEIHVNVLPILPSDSSLKIKKNK